MNLEKFAPDIVSTVRRFPFATFLTALATLVIIALFNDFITDTDETFSRLCFGLATAAIFSLAGVMFAESGRGTPIINSILTYLAPILVIAAMQVRTFEWLMPAPLVAVGFFWLSVAPFTRVETGEAREAAQNRFWWINHRAVATGVLAFAGFCIISLGFVAIERSMALLFGMSGDKLIYSYLLPFTGMFLMPLYWFSTIPRLDEFKPEELTEPDFLSRTIGFLGQFVLVPLLLAYSGILLAYALQIVINGNLPEGTIGWMVLGYLVTGAATWLVLHPPFMRKKQIVRLFRKFWFWLTIVPIILYGTAVFIRVDAYGLTPERILLIAGGAWALLLTLAFLMRRFADVRLIPALAGAILLLISVGPWNFENLAVSQQLGRLTSALDSASWSTENRSPEWTTDQAAAARSAFDFLQSNSSMGDQLKSAFLERGFTETEWDETDLYNANFLNLPKVVGQTRHGAIYLGRPQPGAPVLLGKSNIYFGDINVSNGNIATYGVYTMTIENDHYIINRDGAELGRVDLLEWLEQQDGKIGVVTTPKITLSTTDMEFTFIVTYANFDEEDGQLKAANLSGMLFTDKFP